MVLDLFFVFFFQAEDGIRDSSVTGVQTCALPILRSSAGSHAYRESVTWRRVSGAKRWFSPTRSCADFVCWRHSRLNRNSSNKRFSFPRITPPAPGASPQVPGASFVLLR